MLYIPLDVLPLGNISLGSSLSGFIQSQTYSEDLHQMLNKDKMYLTYVHNDEMHVVLKQGITTKEILEGYTYACLLVHKVRVYFFKFYISLLI